MSQSPIPSLYVICDADVCAAAGWTLLDFAAACLEGGAKLLQIRSKGAPSGQFLDLAAAIVARARGADARVVVNDRADIARMARADGVHVGQGDLSPEAVRAIVGRDAIIGLSTHTAEQLDLAVGRPLSYIAVGPVFGTATKATGYDAIGLGLVRYAARRAGVAALPVVAIGGITLERARPVLEAGAQSLAVVTDLLVTGDPAARVRQFLTALA